MTTNTLVHDKLEKLTNISHQKNYRAYLYDCDGTLADNMPMHRAAYHHAADEYGLDLNTAIIDELAGWPTVLIAEEINKRYGTHIPTEEFAARKSAIFLEHYVSKTQRVDFVVQHLLNHLGKTRIGVVTGGSRKTVTQTLTAIGLLDVIETLVCADDTDRGKPYPDPFLRAAEQLGVLPEDCLVFEDGNPGVEGAIAAGMDWVRIDQL